MIYFKRLELNYRGYRFVTDITNVVTEKDIDKQIGHSLFILKNNS